MSHHLDDRAKTGEWIVLWVPGHGHCRARWNHQYDAFLSHHDGKIITRATHWMPDLPAPPAEGGCKVMSDFVDKCDTCGKRLFEGERGFRYYEGPTFCLEHSPTYREFQQEVEGTKRDEWMDAGDREYCLDRIKRHLDNGGSLDDKYTVEL